MSDSLPELWDIDRVCACLGCSEHLACRPHGAAGFVLCGRKEFRFRPADVAAWLEVGASLPRRCLGLSRGSGSISEAVGAARHLPSSSRRLLTCGAVRTLEHALAASQVPTRAFMQQFRAPGQILPS